MPIIKGLISAGIADGEQAIESDSVLGIDMSGCYQSGMGESMGEGEIPDQR